MAWVWSLFMGWCGPGGRMLWGSWIVLRTTCVLLGKRFATIAAAVRIFTRARIAGFFTTRCRAIGVPGLVSPFPLCLPTRVRLICRLDLSDPGLCIRDGCGLVVYRLNLGGLSWGHGMLTASCREANVFSLLAMGWCCFFLDSVSLDWPEVKPSSSTWIPMMASRLRLS